MSPEFVSTAALALPSPFLIVGLIGGLIGGTLGRLIGIVPTGWIGHIIVAAVGGIVLVAIVRALRHV